MPQKGVFERAVGEVKKSRMIKASLISPKLAPLVLL
jgi:hypothetical protein